MSIYDIVKVYIDELPYLGTIIKKANNIYTVSILGKGDTYTFSENDMIKL